MIGLFDSGQGGLTVLRAVRKALPDRSLIYLGDHGHAPYGNRSPDDIFHLTVAAVDRLFGLGCRLVVLACNTASAVSLRRLQQTWLPGAYPGRRVLGVLVPMVEAITGVPWMAEIPASRHVGQARGIAVFATRRTVASGAYPREIAKRAPEVTVIQQACPDLAARIEAGAPRGELAELVRGYVDDLMRRVNGAAPSTVMLGCTHYPLVADLFAEALPPGTEVLSQPNLASRSLEAYLRRHAEFDDHDAAPLRFFTTGEADRVGEVASRFWGEAVSFLPLSDDPPLRRLRAG